MNSTISSQDSRPPGQGRRTDSQRRPGTASGDAVNEGSGDPIGAWGPCNSGWDEVSWTFRWVAPGPLTTRSEALTCAGEGPYPPGKAAAGGWDRLSMWCGTHPPLGDLPKRARRTS